MSLLASTRIVNGLPMSHIAIGLAFIALVFLLPALFAPKKWKEACENFLKSDDAVFRVAALFHFIIAFFILNTHWSISLKSSRTIMTVLGYLLLLRGILWIWVPGWVKNMGRKFLAKEWSLYLMIFFGLVFTLGLGYLGIWVY